MVLKGWRCSDFTMIQAESHNAFAKFQTWNALNGGMFTWFAV
jgi:hypothetical protein